MTTNRRRTFYDATRPDYRISTDFHILFDDYIGADTDTTGETSTRGNLRRRVYSGQTGHDIEP
jgi:hypothetical protein